MRRAFPLVAVFAGWLALAAAGVANADLAVGDKAPDFQLAGSDGKQYALSQFVGERGVVLAWFPKAFTPG